jgi:hypothetical protein
MKIYKMALNQRKDASHNPITLILKNLNMKKPGVDRAAKLLCLKLNNVIQASPTVARIPYLLPDITGKRASRINGSM